MSADQRRAFGRATSPCCSCIPHPRRRIATSRAGSLHSGSTNRPDGRFDDGIVGLKQKGSHEHCALTLDDEARANCGHSAPRLARMSLSDKAKDILCTVLTSMEHLKAEELEARVGQQQYLTPCKHVAGDPRNGRDRGCDSCRNSPRVRIDFPANLRTGEPRLRILLPPPVSPAGTFSMPRPPVAGTAQNLGLLGDMSEPRRRPTNSFRAILRHSPATFSHATEPRPFLVKL
jgi:hypothetical protein